MFAFKLFQIIGCLSGFLAVGAGAFGAHALKQVLTPAALNVFEIAVRYQLYHALVFFAVAATYHYSPNTPTYISGWLFLAGIILFSGSLYALALTDQRWLGAITPIGGALLLLGWLSLLLGIILL